MKRFSAQEARERLSDILGLVYYGKEPIIVEKRGKAVAVVINPEEYELFLKERENRFQVLDGIWRKADEEADPDEVERIVNEEIHALRRERRKIQNREGSQN